jgi:hypothetical protein
LLGNNDYEVRQSKLSDGRDPGLGDDHIDRFVEPSVAATREPNDEVSNFCTTAAGCAPCRALRCSLFHQWPRRNVAPEQASKNTIQVIEHRRVAAIRIENDLIELLPPIQQRRPLYPDERTSSAWLVPSVRSQNRTNALHQERSFDHLVGASE